MSAEQEPAYEQSTHVEASQSEAKDGFKTPLQLLKESEAGQESFGKWVVESNESLQKNNTDALKGLGEVGTRLVTTLQSSELSAQDKVSGTVGAGLDAAGEAVKWSLNTGPAGGLISMIPGTSEKVDAFIDGAVGSAVDKVVDKNENGTYGFNATGVTEFVSPKGLIKTGVDAVVGGAGAVGEVLVTEDPNSEAGKALEAVNDIYDSPVVQLATKRAAGSIAKRAA